MVNGESVTVVSRQDSKTTPFNQTFFNHLIKTAFD